MKKLVDQCHLCFPWRELPWAQVILPFVWVLMCALGFIPVRTAVPQSCLFQFSTSPSHRVWCFSTWSITVAAIPSPVQSAEGKKRRKVPPHPHLKALPGGCLHHFYIYPIGQNFISCLYPAQLHRQELSLFPPGSHVPDEYLGFFYCRRKEEWLFGGQLAALPMKEEEAYWRGSKRWQAK